jgi:5-methylcytosine-specific restriction protein A
VTKLNGTKISAAKPRIATRAPRLASPKVAASIYQTAEYREWRRSVIGRSGGHCQDPACADPMRSTRLFADHVVELRDGGAPFDVVNGLARCGAYHSKKTLAERARRMGMR